MVISSLLIIISYVLAPKKRYNEKLSAYECGFDPVDGTRGTFEVHFYIVGILFLIFDVEIAYLFPWVIGINSLPLSSYISMYIFLFLLTVGFIFEWKKGALNWANFVKLSD